MLLKGARVARSASEAENTDLSIIEDRIVFGRASRGPVMDLAGCLILPGLINAHDHLEFNLFPRLGQGPYPNASAWAEDVYHPDQSPVREHLRVPKPVRLFWGGIKNLLNGVTTVMHHNPYEPEIFRANFPVRVVARFDWAHSLRFSPELAKRSARLSRDVPFVIHAGEGTDECAREEIARLDSLGLLCERTVVVHGIALDREGVDLMLSHGAALVWCPTSNHFIAGRSLSHEALESGISIALGTDSALSAAGDLVDEIRTAVSRADVARVYRMLTVEAARILRLNRGEGGITEGGVADLLIVRDRGGAPSEALRDLRPEFVFLGGGLKLSSMPVKGSHPLEVDGRGRYWIDCDVPALAAAARQALGGPFRLAGKAVAA